MKVFYMGLPPYVSCTYNVVHIFILLLELLMSFIYKKKISMIAKCALKSFPLLLGSYTQALFLTTPTYKYIINQKKF